MIAMRVSTKRGLLLALAAVLAAGAFIDLTRGRTVSAAMSTAGIAVLALAWSRMGREGRASSRAEPSQGWTPPIGYLVLVAAGSIVATTLVVFLLLDAREDLAREMPLSAVWSGLGMLAGIAVGAVSLISLVLGLSLRLHITGWIEHAARHWFVGARSDIDEDE